MKSYKNYKGDIYLYRPSSKYDTPDERRNRDKLNAFTKCGLISCKSYKTCDLNQIKGTEVKCINYKPPLK